MKCTTTTRAAATAADKAMTAAQLHAIVAAVKVSGTVLHELDAMTQEHCSTIDLLAELALQRLSADPDSLQAVRRLLHMVQILAGCLANGVNVAAEDHGCNYVEGQAEAQPDRPTAAP